jgi:hypothetical protein
MTMNLRSRLIRKLRICSRFFLELTVALTGSFCLTPLFAGDADYFIAPGANG